MRQAIVSAIATLLALATIPKKPRRTQLFRGRTEDEEEPKGNAPRAAQQHLYREIVDARMASAEKRADQLASRAGVLIASAALSASLELKVGNNGWMFLSLILTLGAAASGVLTLVPKKSTYIALESLRPELLKLSPSDAELLYADQQAGLYQQRVKSLNYSGWWLRIGFSLLAASILTRAAQALNVTISIG